MSGVAAVMQAASFFPELDSLMRGHGVTMHRLPLFVCAVFNTAFNIDKAGHNSPPSCCAHLH